MLQACFRHTDTLDSSHEVAACVSAERLAVWQVSNEISAFRDRERLGGRERRGWGEGRERGFISNDREANKQGHLSRKGRSEDHRQRASGLGFPLGFA